MSREISFFPGAQTGARHAITFSAPADNTWRDTYNPWRGMSVTRVIHLLESFPRGEYADFAWTLAAPVTGVESRDADMLTLVNRRCAAVLEMDWDIRANAGADPAAAQEQCAVLRAAYERVENLTEVIEHLALATFRGYALAEPIRDSAGDITRFACVAPWNVIRDGSAGAWKYNPEATQTTFDALGGELLIPEHEWLIRTCPRPVGGLALVKWFREQITDRNWDAAQEIFAVPCGVVGAPPDASDDTRKALLAAAKEIPRGGSIVLPDGATFTATAFPTEIVNLFRERKRDLQERLILAGTGGILTTLAAPTGLNSDAGRAQADAYATLAAGDAMRISECFQRLVDRAVLAKHFPGQPRLAYFLLASAAPDDTAAYVANVATLAGAGYVTDAAEVAEKLGATITKQADGAEGNNGNNGNDGNDGNPPNHAVAVLQNKGQTPLFAHSPNSHVSPDSPNSHPAPAAPATAAAAQADFAPLEERLGALEKITDPGEYYDALLALEKDLPALQAQVAAGNHTATALADATQAAANAGIAEAQTTLKNACDPNHFSQHFFHP